MPVLSTSPKNYLTPNAFYKAYFRPTTPTSRHAHPHPPGDDSTRTKRKAVEMSRSKDREHGSAKASLRPRMDLHEDVEKNIVTATFELPGVSKDRIDVSLVDGRLVIAAPVQPRLCTKEKERASGRYVRALKVPEGIREEDVKASALNGVLTVTFPKTAPENAPKRIVIA